MPSVFYPPEPSTRYLPVTRKELESDIKSADDAMAQALTRAGQIVGLLPSARGEKPLVNLAWFRFHVGEFIDACSAAGDVTKLRVNLLPMDGCTYYGHNPKAPSRVHLFK